MCAQAQSSTQNAFAGACRGRRPGDLRADCQRCARCRLAEQLARDLQNTVMPTAPIGIQTAQPATQAAH